jgi:hypothetical protein
LFQETDLMKAAVAGGFELTAGRALARALGVRSEEFPSNI